MTDQPISKEERDAMESVIAASRAGPSHHLVGSPDDCPICLAIRALDRARTPPKPTTIEERMREASYEPLRIDTRVAARIAREFALEELERAKGACAEVALDYRGAPNDWTNGFKSATVCCSDAIHRLISEARGR